MSHVISFRVGRPAYHGSADEGEAIGRPGISTIGVLRTLERAMISVLWMGPKAAAIARVQDWKDCHDSHKSARLRALLTRAPAPRCEEPSPGDSAAKYQLRCHR